MKLWTILVVEDEFDSLQTIAKILSYHEIQVHVSRNGKECLQALQRLRPTAVVMDIAMPEMDGWQTLAAIRANPATASIPVVAVTAFDSPDIARDALNAGFDGYFPKPISARTFVQALGEVIAKHTRPRE